MSTTTPTSYGEAASILGSRDGLKIANNTYLDRLEVDGCGSIGIRLHSTYVVRFFQQGTTLLDSGGWQTLTTKKRINRYLPAGVSLAQKGGEWHVTDRRKGEVVTVDFSDGMVLQS